MLFQLPLALVQHHLPSFWFSWPLSSTIYLLLTLHWLYSVPVADFYMFDFHHMNWSIILPSTGCNPSARFNHGFTAAFGKLYLFGGKVKSYAAGDLLIMYYFEVQAACVQVVIGYI